MNELAPEFRDEEAAKRYVEARMWPSGPVCPRCKSSRGAYRLASNPDSEHRLRNGVYKCAGCRKKFTVTLGTIFEDSRIPIHKWLLAVELMCTTEKGVNAGQLQRELGLKSYRTALFMSYRIAWALRQPPFGGGS